MISKRQQEILHIIIEHYIKDALPIASSFLAQRVIGKVSSATVRNELVLLENDGYIFQPHTSSGRVPAEKAYRFYIDNNLNKEKELGRINREKIKKIIFGEDNCRNKLKTLAKTIAEISNQAVIVAFEENDNYYTGLANLFSQPEFEKNRIISLSAIVDHLDRVLEKLFARENKNTEILLAGENPFGIDCGAIIGNYKFDSFQGIIAIVGPLRMNYQENYILINETIKLLS
ncbi:hypothetical protein KKC32_00025 [Patescibacteria group bacterium]|nr:hypothetical protein [Patescibacteria group bacterium]